MIKICSKCKIEKPTTEFSKDNRLTLSVNSVCKKCVSVLYYETNQKNRNSESGFLNSKISNIFTPSTLKRRNFVPECTKDEIKKYFYEYVEKHGRNCFYCKKPWTYIANDYTPLNGNINRKIDKGESKAKKIKNFSIDRLDSSKTYSVDNIIFCCIQCNLSKKDISIELIKRLHEIITERNL